MHFSHTPRKLLPHMAMPMRWRDGRQTSGKVEPEWGLGLKYEYVYVYVEFVRPATGLRGHR